MKTAWGMNGGQGINVSHWITWMDDEDLSTGDIGRKWARVIMSRWISQMDGGDWFTGGIGWKRECKTVSHRIAGGQIRWILGGRDTRGLTAGESGLRGGVVLIAPLTGDGWYSYAGE